MLNDYVKATSTRVIFLFSIGLLSPVLAPFLKDLGFDYIQLSILFALFPLVIMFFSAPLGKLADDFGRIKVIKLGIIVQILAVLFYVFGEEMFMVGLARMFNAFSFSAVTIATLAKIQDSVKPEKRGKYTGISFSLAQVGTLIAPVVGGFLADNLFVKSPFYTAILVLILMLFLLPKELEVKKKKHSFNYLKQVKKFLSYKSLRGMAILGIVEHATSPAMKLFLPLLIIENLGLSYSHVGIAYFVMGITHVLQFVFGSWSDKSAYRIVMWGIIISGIFTASIYFHNSYYLLLILLFFRGTGNSMWNVSAWTLMSNVGEKDKVEGEIIGTYGSIAKVGSLFSYVVSGFIVTAFGINILFLLNGLLVLLGSVFAYPLMKE